MTITHNALAHTTYIPTMNLTRKFQPGMTSVSSIIVPTTFSQPYNHFFFHCEFMYCQNWVGSRKLSVEALQSHGINKMSHHSKRAACIKRS